jgi:uncharacterized protein
MALGVGGLVQLLAGMWEFACGNTFGATGEPPSLSHLRCHVKTDIQPLTAFSSYGGFWLSFGVCVSPHRDSDDAIGWLTAPLFRFA